MRNIGYVKMLTTEEDIIKAELLRYEAFNIDLDDLDISNSFYYFNIKNNSIIPFGLFIKDKLVAGCYVSNTYGSLYIDQLFVKPMFQNTGLRFGRMLLRYILVNKSIVEQFFNCQIDKSILEALDEKSTKIYEKEGYVQKEMYMVKKI